jgi:uncharacterized membrane protein YeaQ/YmgE (transglycosylase-associated protein family)
VTIINSVLVGAFAGILASQALEMNPNGSVAIGLGGIFLGFFLQGLFSTKAIRQVVAGMEVRFQGEEA